MYQLAINSGILKCIKYVGFKRPTLELETVGVNGLITRHG